MSWTYEHSWTLAAPPAAVFAALTDRSQLTRWFAEHVDVGQDVGEGFRFWGRHTLETPAPSLATQRITAWDRDHTLGFTWRIAGVDTAITMALSAEGDACRLRLEHAVSGALPFSRERELIDDHWRNAIGNLAAHLAGGRGIALPDHADPSPGVRQTILIDAPRDVVFQALITPDLVNQWFGSSASVIEAHVGGRYDLGWKYQVDGRDVSGGPTRILEYVANERLALDWPDWRGDERVTGQTIRFQLDGVEAQTRVSFVHAGFARAADLGDYPFGWMEILDTLRAVVTARR